MDRNVIAERKCEKIKIPQLWKDDLLIAERYTEDYLDVVEFASKKTGFTSQVTGMAKSISDALKINIENAHSIRRRYFQKILSAKNIMQKLTPHQMSEVTNIINRLEGNKKKVDQANPSDENSHAGSSEESIQKSESEEQNDFPLELIEQQLT